VRKRDKGAAKEAKINNKATDSKEKTENELMTDSDGCPEQVSMQAFGPETAKL